MRGCQILFWGPGSCCVYRLSVAGSASGRVRLGRTYSTAPPSNPAPPEEKGGAVLVKERTLAALQHMGGLGRQWGQRSAQVATATMGYWWGRYEEFVGLNEVNHAQSKVTEAEAAFMYSRRVVREAHLSLEALRIRLKEVRERLESVSREEAQYPELAMQEHKLLQEERRLRTTYDNAERSEREHFATLSANVRESHEKERTRAERTKNWSLIGSVLGALIGVMGSTYINRVRLQELKSLLLEAHRGPESLQEVLQAHRAQQGELQALAGSLREALREAGPPGAKGGGVAVQASSPQDPEPHQQALGELAALGRRSQSLLEALPARLGGLQEGVARLEERLGEPGRRGPPTQSPGPPWGGEGAAQGLEDTKRTLREAQRTLGDQMDRNLLWNSVVTVVTAALSVPALYLLLRGSG